MEQIYDFDLSQWDIKRNNNETWSKYVQRMRGHNAWNTKYKFLGFEFRRGRANTYLNASPNVFYFSYTFSATSKNRVTGYHTPDKDVFLLIRSRAKLIGSRVGATNSGRATDSTWWENDGIVNSKSMRGPTTGQNGADFIVEYQPSKPLIKGRCIPLNP